MNASDMNAALVSRSLKILAERLTVERDMISRKENATSNSAQLVTTTALRKTSAFCSPAIRDMSSLTVAATRDASQASLSTMENASEPHARKVGDLKAMNVSEPDALLASL